MAEGLIFFLENAKFAALLICQDWSSRHNEMSVQFGFSGVAGLATVLITLDSR